MGDIPDPTAGDGLSTSGASASPLTADVEIEDGTSIAAAVWKTLEAEKDALDLPDLKVQSLPDFLKSAELPKLTKDEKATIVSQALLLFQDLYPHLAFKTPLHDFSDPISALTNLASNLDNLSELDFHSAVAHAFGGVLDRHTWYELPAPFRGAVAFLPFQLQFVMDFSKGYRAIVTGVMNSTLTHANQGGGLGHPFFGPGAEIVRWNYLDRLKAEIQVARTGRPLLAESEYNNLEHQYIFSPAVALAFFPPPDDMDRSVVLQYIARGGGPVRVIRFPWGVATNLGSHTGFPHAAYSLNVPTATTSSATQAFAFQGGLLLPDPSSVDLQRFSTIPEAFEFQHTGGTAHLEGVDPAMLRSDSKPDGKFGYIRIRQFSARLTSADELVAEFRRILRDVMNRMAPDGLILDVRGNPGGDIQAAERMLQMLTAAHILPMQFHLANTPAVQKVLETLQPETLTNTQMQTELQLWIGDLGVSKANGGPLTTGHPLTPEDQANTIGQIYHGPCVLLIDSITYSTAEMFAAGFQDHGIGLIIGVCEHTGGGGANVWSHDDLLDNFPSSPDLPLQALPPVADAGDNQRPAMSLAIRRCLRVGRNVSKAIEDAGVAADVFTSASAEDLLAGFPAVIGLACKVLAEPKDFSLEIRNVTFGATTIEVDLQTTALDWLYFEFTYVYGGPTIPLACAVQPGVPQSFSLPIHGPAPAEVKIQGCISYPGAAGTNHALAVTRTISYPTAKASTA